MLSPLHMGEAKTQTDTVCPCV